MLKILLLIILMIISSCTNSGHLDQQDKMIKEMSSNNYNDRMKAIIYYSDFFTKYYLYLAMTDNDSRVRRLVPIHFEHLSNDDISFLLTDSDMFVRINTITYQKLNTEHINTVLNDECSVLGELDYSSIVLNKQQINKIIKSDCNYAKLELAKYQELNINQMRALAADSVAVYRILHRSDVTDEILDLIEILYPDRKISGEAASIKKARKIESRLDKLHKEYILNLD